MVYKQRIRIQTKYGNTHVSTLQVALSCYVVYLGCVWLLEYAPSMRCTRSSKRSKKSPVGVSSASRTPGPAGSDMAAPQRGAMKLLELCCACTYHHGDDDDEDRTNNSDGNDTENSTDTPMMTTMMIAAMKTRMMKDCKHACKQECKQAGMQASMQGADLRASLYSTLDIVTKRLMSNSPKPTPTMNWRLTSSIKIRRLGTAHPKPC